MSLEKHILIAAKEKGIDPYLVPFKPSDLGLTASNYGSFSDHCSKNETISGKWAKDEILKVVERKSNGAPKRYLLLKNKSRLA